MAKNITLKVDDEIYKKARHIAVDMDLSLSAWISELIKKHVEQISDYNHSSQTALAAMDNPANSNGMKINRENLYEERLEKWPRKEIEKKSL